MSAVTTSTATVVVLTGSRFTVTGTFSLPPLTFSATEATWSSKLPGSVPKETKPLSLARIVTSMESDPRTDQPRASVLIVTAKHSFDPPTRSSLSAVGNLTSASSLPTGTFRVDGRLAPRSSLVAALQRLHRPVGMSVPRRGVRKNVTPPARAGSDSLTPTVAPESHGDGAAGGGDAPGLGYRRAVDADVKPYIEPGAPVSAWGDCW